MQFILIEIQDVGPAYQEISYGVVQRYLGLDGVELFRSVPSGKWSEVIDANPPTPTWYVEPTPEPEVVVVPQARQITILAFRDRLTMDEKRAIYTEAKTNVDVQIWIDELNAVQDGRVDLDDPRITYGLTALLGEARALEIINA